MQRRRKQKGALFIVVFLLAFGVFCLFYLLEDAGEDINQKIKSFDENTGPFQNQ